MMNQSICYSDEIAEEILNRFNSKGWNLYKSKKLHYIGGEENIRQNLVDKLDVNIPHVLLPSADNPRDPGKVMGALNTLAKKLKGEMPTIKIGHESYPLTGITLRDHDVKIHTPEGTCISYPLFMEALDSIVKTN